MLQDIIIGIHLAGLAAAIRSRPLYVVVLAPRADVVQARGLGSQGSQWKHDFDLNYVRPG